MEDTRRKGGKKLEKVCVGLSSIHVALCNKTTRSFLWSEGWRKWYFCVRLWFRRTFVVDGLSAHVFLHQSNKPFRSICTFPRSLLFSKTGLYFYILGALRPSKTEHSTENEEYWAHLCVTLCISTFTYSQVALSSLEVPTVLEEHPRMLSHMKSTQFPQRPRNHIHSHPRGNDQITFLHIFCEFFCNNKHWILGVSKSQTSLNISNSPEIRRNQTTSKIKHRNSV